jgi:hypothetical protein
MARFNALLQSLARPPAAQEGLFEAARGIAQMPAMLSGQRQAREQRQQLADIYGAAIAPDATSQQMTQAAQQLLQVGKVEEAMALAEQAREAQAKVAEQERLNARKSAMITRAASLNLEDQLAESIRTAPSHDTLDDIAADMRDLQIKNLPSQTPAQRWVLARSVGLTKKEYDDAGLATSSDDYFKDYINGLKGKTEAWTDSEGTIKAVRFSESGKAWDDENKMFVEPSDLGLVQKAPSVQKVIDASNKMIEALADESVQDIVTKRDKARTAKSKIDVLNRQLDRLEGGMPTGIAANIQVGLAQVGQLMGMPYNPELINAQEYMMEVANLVKQEIKAFGSGTSITDADREYTQRMVGGDITQQAEALEKMLNIYKEAAETTIKEYNEVVKKTSSKLGEENMGSFQPITMPAEGLSPAAQKYITPTQEG